MAQPLPQATVQPRANTLIYHAKQDADASIHRSSSLPDLLKDAAPVRPTHARPDIIPRTGTWIKRDISAKPAYPYRPPMPPERKMGYPLPQAVPYCAAETDMVRGLTKKQPTHTDFPPPGMMPDGTPEVPEAGWLRRNITAPIQLGAYVTYKKAIEPTIEKVLDTASTCAEHFEEIRPTIPTRINAAGKGAKIGILTGAYLGIFYAYNKIGMAGLALLPLSIPLGLILSIAASIYGAGAGFISMNPDAPKKLGKLLS